jgi:hypothetical protein
MVRHLHAAVNGTMETSAEAASTPESSGARLLSARRTMLAECRNSVGGLLAWKYAAATNADGSGLLS